MATIFRNMVGTKAASVIWRWAISDMADTGSKRVRMKTLPPLISVSSENQMPKTKLSCSTRSARVADENLSTPSIARSLPAKAEWPSTTPLATPVEPEVKMMSAAPASRGRTGGAGKPARHFASPLPTINRADTAARVASMAMAGMSRLTGTATPPAAQTPRKPAMSRGLLATRTSTGSFG